MGGDIFTGTILQFNTYPVADNTFIDISVVSLLLLQDFTPSKVNKENYSNVENSSDSDEPDSDSSIIF